MSRSVYQDRPSWAGLLINGEEIGERLPCRVIVSVDDGKLCVKTDREVTFPVEKQGCALVRFFGSEHGEDHWFQWNAQDPVAKGDIISIGPKA